MKLERKVVLQAASDSGDTSITLFRAYKNFQTWYDIEIDRWIDGKVVSSRRDFLDTDQAFNYFDNYALKNNLRDLGVLK
jgi:hypothetical protein